MVFFFFIFISGLQNYNLNEQTTVPKPKKGRSNKPIYKIRYSMHSGEIQSVRAKRFLNLENRLFKIGCKDIVYFWLERTSC